jgi:hypothetical protein
MAFDSAARRHGVVFGGRHAGGYDGDTWSGTAAPWTRRATTGPSPRYSHAMDYDSRAGSPSCSAAYDRSVLTTARRGEWDGNAWTLRSTTSPTPRYGHAMVYDSARGVTVLVRRRLRPQERRDLGVDGSTWSIPAPPWPSPR